MFIKNFQWCLAVQSSSNKICHELSQIQMMTKIKELYQKIQQIKQKKNLKVEQVSADRLEYDIL
jgi:hypothetical protein